MMTTIERWTTADLARFPDDDGLRYEIIDGELHVTKAPGTYHQIVASRVVAALDAWSAAARNGLAIATPGIILVDEDNLIPDAVWISAARFAAALGDDEKLHELPELVVEVLSPGPTNVRRDREEKLAVYARGGVLEYWIVDWPRRRLDVYRSDAPGALPLADVLAEQDTLQSPLLPGFTLPIARLFVGLPS